VITALIAGVSLLISSRTTQADNGKASPTLTVDTSLLRPILPLVQPK